MIYTIVASRKNSLSNNSSNSAIRTLKRSCSWRMELQSARMPLIVGLKTSWPWYHFSNSRRMQVRKIFIEALKFPLIWMYWINQTTNQMNQPTNQPTNEWMNEWMNEWITNTSFNWSTLLNHLCIDVFNQSIHFLFIHVTSAARRFLNTIHLLDRQPS